MGIFKFRTSTSPFVDEVGKVIKDSIAEFNFVTLGGIKQWVLLRGLSVHRPILLCLHGGPGTSIQGIFRYYNRELENHFLVVGWDQRGACKSYNRKIDPASMTLSQFIQDLHELVQYLRHRFPKNKIHLMGESWGSILGTLYVKKHPEDIASYIGIGQVSEIQRSEALSYQFTIAEAEKRNDKKALRELRTIQTPGNSYQDVLKQRKWLVKFGGLHFGKSSALHLLPKVLSLDEYALPDLLWLALGSKMTLPLLWPEVYATNLFKQAPSIKVPVHFLVGKHDHCTSTTLATEYYEALEAPSKKITFFENCGHNPFLEVPNQFNEAVIKSCTE